MKKTLKIFALICCLVLTLALSSCENWFSFIPNGTTTQTTITEPPHEHNFSDADCLNPKTCECGETEGEALGHTPADDDGDCTTDVLCTACECVLVEKQEGHVDEDHDYICDVDGCDKEVLLSISTVDDWMIQESRRQWKREGKEYTFAQMEAWAKEATPFRSIINVDHPTFATPGNMPEKIREYCRMTGQPVPSSVGEVVRAIYEGLALKYRFVAERIQELIPFRFSARRKS